MNSILHDNKNDLYFLERNCLQSFGINYVLNNLTCETYLLCITIADFAKKLENFFLVLI